MCSNNAHSSTQNAESGFSFSFFIAVPKDGNEFLIRSIQVTGDETWVSFVNVETKEQTKQWTRTHSPNEMKKFVAFLPVRKLMANVFWDRKGVLIVGIHATRHQNNVIIVLRNVNQFFRW
jgi:hypothetical protein